MTSRYLYISGRASRERWLLWPLVHSSRETQFTAALETRGYPSYTAIVKWLAESSDSAVRHDDDVVITHLSEWSKEQYDAWCDCGDKNNSDE